MGFPHLFMVGFFAFKGMIKQHLPDKEMSAFAENSAQELQFTPIMFLLTSPGQAPKGDQTHCGRQLTMGATWLW